MPTLSFGRAAHALALAAASITICATVAGSERVTITFERAAPGTLPRPFLAMSSHEAESGRWEVTRLGGEHVLTQAAVGRSGYRLAALETQIEHVRLGARLRVAERGDRAAGVAWRVRDAENYYAARVDFREREFVLHKFVGGNHPAGEARRYPPGARRLARPRRGARRRDDPGVAHGIPVAAERDRSLRGPGKIALWMPGDSSGHFSRLLYEPLDRN